MGSRQPRRQPVPKSVAGAEQPPLRDAVAPAAAQPRRKQRKLICRGVGQGAKIAAGTQNNLDRESGSAAPERRQRQGAVGGGLTIAGVEAGRGGRVVICRHRFRIAGWRRRGWAAATGQVGAALRPNHRAQAASHCSRDRIRCWDDRACWALRLSGCWANQPRDPRGGEPGGPARAQHA